MQLRVQLQLDRLAYLERKYRLSHITVAEAREIFRLREMILRRKAHRGWLVRGDNRERSVESARRWRAANPGCC